MKWKIKIKIFLSGVFLGILTPAVVFATSSLELFPDSFTQTINLYATDPRIIIARIINAVLLFLGIVAVALILYGGFLWMTSAGNEEKIDRAKKLLISAAIGLLIILSSFALARFIISRLVDSLGGGEGIGFEEACATCSVPSGPSGSSFLVKNISPRGSVPLRNITARVVLNKAPAPASLESSVVVSTVTDNALVPGNLEISGATIKFTPEAPCPAPNQDRKCFAADTDFKIEVKPSLTSVDGRGLTCLGLNAPCEAEFHTGSLVDTTPPQVVMETPDNGESFAVDTCVPMQAKVTDDSGVGSADFYADGDFVDSAAPSEETSPKQAILEIPCWDTTGLPTPSFHNLSAVAFDIDANRAVSSKVKVAVRPAHCFNDVKDDSEDGVDCSNTANGASGCGLCDGGACKDSADCAGGLCDNTTKTCVSYPKIMDVTPGDGAEGTMVTISGLNFGQTPGKVFFSNNLSAVAPAACDPKTSWTSQQIIVGVPKGAVDGPIKVCTTAGLCDESNDGRGAIVPTHSDAAVSVGFFDVNSAVHPGLCQAFSPTPHTACNPSDPQADAKCQNENKDAVGNPDKSAFCHPQKNYCVFPKGQWNAAIYLEGKQFGEARGSVIFGDGASRTPSNWQADGQAQTVLPPLKYGMTKVQILAAAGTCGQNGFCTNNSVQPCLTNEDCLGTPSNAVNYTVLSPDANTMPVILDISPNHGGPGTGLTIIGNNFGQDPGVVYFVAPDGQQAQADIESLPSQCAKSGAWWTSNYVTIKVPKVLDINDFNKNGNKTEILSGNYKIYLRRYDSVESVKKDFTVDQTPPGPIIWCLDPDNGPNFTNVTVYGENFGSSPNGNAGRGVFFAMPNGVNPTPAMLVNTGGTPGGDCPAGGWSSKKICAQVPAEAVSGQVRVKTECQGTDCASNPKFFTIGSCQAPKVLQQGGKEINNPSYSACAVSEECCGDGVCRPGGACQATKKDSAYGWEFSTKPTEIYPELVKECLSDFNETKETAGRFPSPSPWIGWKGGESVCVNAQVSARFNAALDASTLSTENVILEQCQGVETENLLANGGFELDLTNSQWQIIDAKRLAVTQVAAPQADLPDDAQTAPGTNNVLRLEKLQAEPDRSLGESVSEKKDGNQYRDSFAVRLPLSLDSYNKEYKFSVQVKAAVDTAGRMTSVGQKAGILLRKTLTDGTVEEEKTAEVELKDTWQTLGLSQKFGKSVGNVEIRLFLASPPWSAGAQITDFYKYAAYFDDLKINDLNSVNCQNAQKVAAVLQAQPDNKQAGAFNGFTLIPGVGGSDALEPDTWYRVTLKTGLKALSQNGLTGKNMKEDAARCGQGSGECWLFKTGSSTCVIKNVWVVPTPYTASVKEEKINYNAFPGGEDVCLSLNPQGLDWTWHSSDASKASLPGGLSGKACQYDYECPVGPEAAQGKQGPSCVQNHCLAMPWTATATALAETAPKEPVQIIAMAKEKSGKNISQDGAADLNIHFTDPKVVDFWPACQAACLNASLGLRFNVAMNPATLLVSNFKVMESACGNGQKQDGEQCDDGNKIDGDGCSSHCLLEGANYAKQCGNGRPDPGEDCDDGNAQNGDGCSSQCLHEGTAPPTCGNGRPDPGEDCDDGNTKSNDGCSSKCLYEGTRSDIAVCGNGRKEKGEECERSESGFPDWCDSVTCLLKGTMSISDGGTCGNGAVDPGEQCDPKSKLLDSAAKRALCNNHCLWTGTFKPAAVGGAGCGNGKPELGEACDDGNTINNDGCSEICLDEGAKAQTVPICGNGNQEPSEECDDGNAQNGDGCSSKCLHEGTGKSICGNSIVEKGEACDLGNKPEAEWSNQNCDRITCLKTGTTGKVDEQGKVLCGNGHLDTGEDCDTAIVGQAPWCNNNCLWKGRGDNLVSLAAPEIIYSEQKQPVGVSLTPVDLLSPNTQYTVTARALRSASGKAMPDFIWNFSTKGEECAVSQVEINPASVTVYAMGTTVPYASVPRSQPDVCSAQGQRLNAASYDWGWTSANEEVATVAHLDNTPPQTAQATAIGLSKQDIIAKNIASVTQIKAEIGNEGDDKGKNGTGDFAVVCGFKDDAACVAANNNDYTLGRGDDTCCYKRPTVTQFFPEQRDNVCPNGLFSVTFSTLMDQGSLPNNFVLARKEKGTCPQGSEQVDLYGEADETKSDVVWCAGEIKTNLIVNNDDFDNNRYLETKVTVQPTKLLQKDSEYRLIVRGDRDLQDDKKAGVRSIFGVALDVAAEGTVWQMKTGSDVCKISSVKIETDEPQDGSGEKTQIKKANAERSLTARAYSGTTSGGQEIVPISGAYDWTWQWVSSDDKNEITTLTPVSTSPQKAQLKAKNKNGEVVVTATANITDKTGGQETSPAISGTQKFTIFICENPWPSGSGFPYQDITAPATNFSTFYCRDAGGAGTDDDLPDLRPVAKSYIGQTRVGEMTMAAKDVVLKEFLFTVPYSQDVIGIRVMQNPKWLSALSWYKDQGFIGDPQPLAQAIDGYEAIQDGTTVYVAAANDSGTLIYPNIYLISYNADASTETKNIRDQIVNNFHLNVNLPDNQRVCDNSSGEKSGKPCAQDVDCGTGGTCQAPKDKLLRDVKRVKDMMSIAQSLESYKSDKDKGNGSYPRLEAGSYLRGLSNSQWPSWSAVLGNDLQTALPDDPLGQSVGLYQCQAAGNDFDKTTCWNEKTQEFVCPPGSQIYQYRNVGPTKFELSADFEYARGQGRWYGFSASGENDFVTDYCAAWGNAWNLQGFCGDGKVTIGKEECDRGQTRWESCAPDSSKPNDKTGLQQQVCRSDCQGWQNAAESGCQTNIACGNGKKDAGEACDSGTLNGAYKYCNSYCGKQKTCVTGSKAGSTDKSGVICTTDADCGNGQCSILTSFCGDGKINGPEKCDDGVNNGKYGHCRLDCSGVGPKCGDKKLDSDYGEECEAEQKTSASGYCAGGTNELEPCNSNTDCLGGGICQICPQYTRCSKDSNKVCVTDADCAPDLGTCAQQQFVLDWKCSALCKWSAATTVCYPSNKPLCGNGSKDGDEECDDGNTNDNDGCTNDCKISKCGDGKVQSAKICLVGDKTLLYKDCTKDSDCGTNGKCYASEACDLGDNNGKVCTADYGATCVYCNAKCQKAYVQGEFCGDKTKTKNGPEVCDWAQGTNQDANAAKNYQSKEEFDPTKEVCADNCLSKCPDTSKDATNGGYAKGVLLFGDKQDVTYKFSPDTQKSLQTPNDCRLINGAGGLKLNLKFSRNNVKNNGGAGVNVILATDAGANWQTAQDAATTLIDTLCDQYKNLKIGLVFKERVPSGTAKWNIVGPLSSCSDKAALRAKVPSSGPSGVPGSWVYTADALDAAKSLIPSGHEQDSLIILLSDGDPRDGKYSSLTTPTADADSQFETLNTNGIQTVVVDITSGNGGADCQDLSYDPQIKNCVDQMRIKWTQDGKGTDERPYIIYNGDIKNGKTIDDIINALTQGVTVNIKLDNGNTLSKTATEYGEMIFDDMKGFSCKTRGTISAFFIASLLDKRQVEINGTLDYCSGPPFACTADSDCPDSTYKCQNSRCIRQKPPAPPDSGSVWCGGKYINFNSASTCGNCVDDKPVIQDCTHLGYNRGYTGNFMTCQNNQCVCDSQQGYVTNGVCPTGYPRCSNNTYYSCSTLKVLDQITQEILFTCVLPKTEQCDWGCAYYGCKAAPCVPQCSGGKQCGSDTCGGLCGSCSGSQTCNSYGQCEGGTDCPAGNQCYTEGEKKCVDGGQRVCTRTSPTCLQWYGRSCSAGDVCVNGSCTACGGAGQACCANNSCNSSLTCQSGVCAANCQNTCSPSGSTRCIPGSSTGTQTCTDCNNDGCVEWCSPQSCEARQVCQNGTCCLPSDVDCSSSTGCVASRDCCSGSGRNVCGLTGGCKFKCY